MAVSPRALETPERGAKLETREEAPRATEPRDAAAELRTLQEKIAALAARPAPEAPRVDTYSKDWWRRGYAEGWKAALEAITRG